MRGLLITNKYLTSEKFSILRDGFIGASRFFGVELDYKNNVEAYNLLNKKVEYDFILFYDKDLKLAFELEKTGYRLFNKQKAIDICDDKFLTYECLEKTVRQPYTISSPAIYAGDLSNDIEFVEKVENEFSYPFIMKEAHGSFGFQVYKVDKRDQFLDYLVKVGTKSFIIQEFVSSSFGKDVRLQVVGGNVICAMKRINENGDFRANLTNGAKAYKYDATQGQIDIALRVSEKIGLDFAGIDILFGENDEPIFCEANSNAHLENISSICNINVYKEVINYIYNSVK